VSISSQDVESAIPKLQVLSEDQRNKIFSATLEVMERTGLRIHHSEILSMLKDAGSHVENGVAHITAQLVERCLSTAPKSFQIYTRDGEPAMRLGEDISYFGAGVGAPFILDSFDGKRRLFTKRDVEQGALVQDALPNIDFVMAMGEISDVPDPFLANIHQFQAMLFNTSKPINFMSTSLQDTSDIIEMAAVVAGSEDNLREKPFIIMFGVGPTPPLTFVESKLERFLLCVDKGIPIVSLSAAASGGTAPVTLAGHIVCSLAEMLTAVVMSQLRVQGAPTIIGGMPLLMDMKTCIFSYGAPEFHLANAAISEIVRSLGIPSYGTAGISDSKILDEQAAIESISQTYSQVLSRTNLIHDVGFLESALIGSFDMLVMSDEIIGMVKRFCRGIRIDEEHLAIDVLHKVGPGGNFISEIHTLNHFRKEQWRPSLINRERYETWYKGGSTTLKDRVNERVKSILNTHKPRPIEDKKRVKILEIINRRSAAGKFSP